MGGDQGPFVVVEAVVAFLTKYSDVRIILVGSSIACEFFSASCSCPNIKERVELMLCSVQVDDSEKPTVSLRNKRDSSMAKVIELVALGDAHACVSAGNTGTMMSFGKRILKTLPGITRPAICASMPTLNGSTLALDLGANLECSAEQLHQFARLGSLTAKCLHKIDNPSIKLLNIGVEAMKGTPIIREAAKQISQDDTINYCGFIEPNQIFLGNVDVIVCDGISGNIALKASEGVAEIITELYQKMFDRNWISRFGAFFFKRSASALKKNLNPSDHNGAFFLGLEGIVIKSHGSANTNSFGKALVTAKQVLDQNIFQVLKSNVIAQFVTTTKS
tara:strand:- start:264 stop:1265 length:1002 start_codon:yes stop_codon:yes gene_type:complete